MSNSESTSLVQPYLFFGGRCEEAIEFYKRTLGAEVEMMMRFKECPDPQPEEMLPAGYRDKIMHSSFRIGKTTVMASDGCGEITEFNGFCLSITLPSEEECRTVFAALSQGGQVKMPLEKTFWSQCFGMVEDQFGLGWMISV